VEQGDSGGMGQMIFQEGGDTVLKKYYLYLDTCTTKDQIIDLLLLTKIKEVSRPLTLHTNAESSQSTKQGYL
jgi:hypothetical protein